MVGSDREQLLPHPSPIPWLTNVNSGRQQWETDARETEQGSWHKTISTLNQHRHDSQLTPSDLTSRQSCCRLSTSPEHLCLDPHALVAAWKYPSRDLETEARVPLPASLRDFSICSLWSRGLEKCFSSPLNAFFTHLTPDSPPERWRTHGYQTRRCLHTSLHTLLPLVLFSRERLGFRQH